MLRGIILLTLLLVINITNAQDKINGVVEFHFIINNPDGTSFANPYKLYFSNQESLYISMGEGPIKLNNSNDNRIGDNGEQVVSNIMKSSLPEDYVYTVIKKKKLIFRDNLVRKSYVVQDKLGKIDWKLLSESKKIGDYNCQKAIGTFRGREYTVWFTPDIPVSHGPWKLRGLPGLIIEADGGEKYSFKAIKINLNPKNRKSVNKALQEPENEKYTSMDTYIAAVKNRQKDFEAMILASMPRGSKVKKNCEHCPKAEDMHLEIWK